jgi:uncharacterized coiled-coil DUF342 family protein
MVTSHEVETQLKATLDVAARAFETDLSAGYEAFSFDIGKLESLAREAFQAKMEDYLWPILNKLEQGESLTTAELDMLQLMIVGEAKYYVKSENDVENWKRELERLLQEIEQLQASGLDDIEALMHLRALCREASRVLPDLAFYFREKERLRKFKEATRGAVDRDTRRMLANLVKDMLQSDKI